MGYLDRETMQRLIDESADIVPATELPQEPATPLPKEVSVNYPKYDQGSDRHYEVDVKSYEWGDVFKGARAEQLAAELLRRFGVNVDSEHMKDTPGRYVRMMQELTTPEAFNFTTFEATSDEMVVLSPIPFYTLCAHHVVPFYGKAHIGYVPGGRIAGLSKFTRLVKNMAKGLWVQEDLTAAIADGIEEELQPRGTAVILRGEHMCMSMRGVCTPGVVTSTQTMRGVFADHNRTAKMEFLEAIRTGVTG